MSDAARPAPPLDPVVVRRATPRQLAALLNAGTGVAAAPPASAAEAEAPTALPPPTPVLPLPARLARGDAVPMLLFSVGGEWFLAPLSDVREAVDAPAVVPVPRMQGATRGVLALRGTLLPVRDPAGTLGVAPATGGAALVVHAERPQALLVDDVLDAVPVAARDLRPVPGAMRADDLLLGAAPVAGRLAGVLDLPPFLLALDLSDR